MTLSTPTANCASTSTTAALAIAASSRTRVRAAATAVTITNSVTRTAQKRCSMCAWAGQSAGKSSVPRHIGNDGHASAALLEPRNPPIRTIT